MSRAMRKLEAAIEECEREEKEDPMIQVGDDFADRGVEHGDVGDFDRRVSSCLATAFGADWSGFVVAVAMIDRGRLVSGSARTLASGRMEETWLTALASMGFSEVVP